MTSLKTSSPKLTSKEQDDNELHLKESKEQDDNQLHLEERTILSFGNDDDSSFHSDKPEVEDKEIAEMLADLTEDENEQLVKRTPISKKEKKRRPVEKNEQHYESPAHLTRKKAKAAGIIVSKDGTRTRTEDVWV